MVGQFYDSCKGLIIRLVCNCHFLLFTSDSAPPETEEKAALLLKGRKEGRKEGREGGRKEGREDGREGGREGGRTEGRKDGREGGREIRH